MAEIGIDIERAAQILREGELVAIPTETVYGLAAHALQSDAVLKIFTAKQRPHFDPLIVHISDVGQLATVASHVPEKAKTLAALFWPGPLTMVLPKAAAIPDLVTSGLETVAVRMPRHPMALDLLRTVGFPLAAPSANPFGYVSPTTAAHVADQMGHELTYILDGGPCEVGLESTIISLEGPQPMILRVGGTPVEAIEKAIGPLQIAPHSSDNPKAPGMLSSHYATGTPLVVGDVETLAAVHHDRKFAVLGWRHTHGHQGIALSPDGKMDEAATRLFAAMRTLDQRKEFDLIIAEKMPDSGLGRAINDRLGRAAFKNPL